MARKRRNAAKPMKAVTAFLAAAAVIFAGAAIYYGIRGEAETDAETVLVYFHNAVTLTWEPEARKIQKGAERDMVAATVREWLAGPKSDQLAAAAPPGQPFEEVKLADGGIVEVTFDETYNGLSAEEAVICNASIVYTLTSLSFVNDVRIFVGDMALLKDNGTPIGALTRGTVVVSGAGLAGEENTLREFTVYFAGEGGAFLLPVKREVAVDPNLPIEKYIVEQIIKGPSEAGAYAVISPDVKLNSVKTEDGGKCYVDFSDDFLKKFDGGSAAGSMLIYSIVNSLTEQPNVKEVQFLIDGEVILDPRGLEMDLSKPVSRDAGLIEK